MSCFGWVREGRRGDDEALARGQFRCWRRMTAADLIAGGVAVVGKGRRGASEG